jgi:hypothetical protein
MADRCYPWTGGLCSPTDLCLLFSALQVPTTGNQ